jgi:hypothetical protein
MQTQKINLKINIPYLIFFNNLYKNDAFIRLRFIMAQPIGMKRRKGRPKKHNNCFSAPTNINCGFGKSKYLRGRKKNANLCLSIIQIFIIQTN